MTIRTHADLTAATIAFRNWGESQSLAPHELVAVCEYFLAAMIRLNSSTPGEIADRLTFIHTSISDHLLDLTK